MNGPPPRWFWLLPLLAAAAWWPLSPWWQSDDLFALHHTREFATALRDFAGPQYGATDIWWFYRPLVTLSFWVDQQLGGPWPPFAHAMNVLVHAGCALLAGLVWRRFTADRTAFAAGLLWALLPSHVGAIAWAAGRSDLHATAWSLLTLWLVLRRAARQRQGIAAPAWPLALATAAALGSKEVALALPALATLVAFADAPAGRLAARAREALAGAAVPWLVLAAYLPLRWLCLGRLAGGYTGQQFDPATMLGGLLQVLAQLAVPLRWIGLPPAGGTVAPGLWLAAGALPVVVAIVLAAVRRPRLVLGAAATFLVAAAPMAPLLAAAGNAHTLRYYHLPAVALAGAIAVAGRGVPWLVLLAWAWPFVAARAEQQRADHDTAAIHRALLREAELGAPAPLFVAGLPAASPHGIAVQVHLGVDRLLAPPFREPALPLYALRPLIDGPGIFRLAPADQPPFALPAGSTWFFADPSALGLAPAGPPLPDLAIAGDDDGVVDLTTPRLEALARRDVPMVLTTPGLRAAAYRLTLFTAGGYLTTVVHDGAGDHPHGAIDLYRWFAGDDGRPTGIGSDGPPLLEALAIPVTTDLDPSFPVLLEAGEVVAGQFVPTHRARRLLRMRFDRGYPALLRRVQGRTG